MSADNIQKHAVPAGLENAHVGPDDYARLYAESIDEALGLINAFRL